VPHFRRESFDEPSCHVNGGVIGNTVMWLHAVSFTVVSKQCISDPSHLSLYIRYVPDMLISLSRTLPAVVLSCPRIDFGYARSSRTSLLRRRRSIGWMGWGRARSACRQDQPAHQRMDKIAYSVDEMVDLGEIGIVAYIGQPPKTVYMDCSPGVGCISATSEPGLRTCNAGLP